MRAILSILVVIVGVISWLVGILWITLGRAHSLGDPGYGILANLIGVAVTLTGIDLLVHPLQPNTTSRARQS